jgi:DNA-binding response OmpR family regulator
VLSLGSGGVGDADHRKGASGPGGRGRHVRVLLVEDEERLALTVKDGLVGEGFVVDIVGDGVSAVWAATEFSYDVVVLDIMLPGLNGYDVLKRLREQKIWTPVLMLTAKDGEYDQTDAFDLGADDYLTKPFSFMILVARLRALVRRGAPERPVQVTVGSLVLDPSRRHVERLGRPLQLTAREYGLLAFLMRRAGDVVSKTEILENVWDAAYSGGDNVVEVYISYLRRKIDEPFGLQTLRTVRGLGYRLDADQPGEATLPPNGTSRPARR